MQRLVPVLVGQTVEQPKGVIVRLPVPSLKRLLPLNECLLLTRKSVNPILDARHEFTGNRIAELISVIEDRELPFVMDFLAVLFCKAADQMVECGAEVIQGLSDIDAAEWRRRAEHTALYDKVARIGLQILDDSAVFTLNELPDFFPERIQVLYGPTEFQRYPSSGIDHEVYQKMSDKDQAKQKTPKGHKILIPNQRDFFRHLK
jgi:hypothetical protein